VVGIPQIKARNALLSKLERAQAKPCHPFARLGFGRNAGIHPTRTGALSRPCLQLAPFPCGLPHAVTYSTAMLPRFSATERFINNTKSATANVNTATIQKQSK